MSTSSRRKFDVAISEVNVILWARGTGGGCVCGVCLLGPVEERRILRDNSPVEITIPDGVFLNRETRGVRSDAAIASRHCPGLRYFDTGTNTNIVCLQNLFIIS